jgi:Fe-S cluster assembly protein SufD
MSDTHAAPPAGHLPAADAFATLGWPSTRLESWRWFSTRALETIDLAATLPLPPAERLPPLCDADGTIAIVNGVPWLAGSRPGAYDAWISIDRGPFGPSDAEHGWDSGLEAANAAFGGAALVVDVPADASPPYPLVLRVHSLGDGVAHPRIRVKVGARSRLALIIEHGGEGVALSNVVTSVEAAAGASITWTTIIRCDQRATHIDSQLVRLGADATCRTFTATLRAARARTAASVQLVGQGADARCDGLYLPAGEARFDHWYGFDHVAPRSRSHATWAAAIDGQATGTFQGRVRIGANVPGCATRQLTRSLLLAPTATANAKPELHIDCDEVEASHGATVGQLDARQLFYLVSRGIHPEAARAMLVAAFVRDAVGRVPDEARARVAAAVAAVVGDAGDGNDDTGFAGETLDG